MRIISLLAVLFLCPSLWAAYQFGFGNISANHLNWSQGTEDKSTKRDFVFFEIEGGAQHSWGELYGFFDLENPGKPGDELRTASKGNLRYYLGQSNVSLYVHEYSFHSLGFSDQNRVLGLGYQIVGEGWWFKPFFGFHEVSQTFYSGSNGYMLGWILGYSFKFSGQNFMFTNWHETEIERADAYANGNGGSKTGQNGAASLWWDFAKDLTLGLQWRYAQNKLGTPGTMDALITTLKYNF